MLRAAPVRSTAVADGSVRYRHRSDRREWFAGTDVGVFREAAGAWNSYTLECAGNDSASATVAAVEALERRLRTIGVLEERPDNVWTLFLEQAADGFL